MVFPNYPVLILLAPLAAGLIVGVLGRSVGPKVAVIGVAAEVMAFVFSLVLLYEVTTHGPQTIDLPRWSDGILQFGMYIDRLAAVMMVHIAAISTLIHLFSIRYMQQERGYARFHSLLALTTFVLLGMVASANLLMLFVFWQLLSWLLSFLSYNYSHPSTARGAFRTFTMLAAGRYRFSARLSCLLIALYGTLDLQQLFIRAAEVHSAFSALAGVGIGDQRITAITLLIFIGAMSKSAQFPLHMWLPDSLYAPTPVHALAACWNHQCRRLPFGPSGPTLRPQPNHPPCGLCRRSAHCASGLIHDAHPERHQKNLGLLHHGADGLHDYGVRSGRLRA